MTNLNRRNLRFWWRIRLGTLLASLCLAATQNAFAEGYLVQPGDTIRISVWKEPDLLQDLLIPPDGMAAFPLVGRFTAANRTIADIQTEIVGRIEEYIPEPVVTVQILGTSGNTVYVLGKVNRPGAFIMTRPLDVVQALALAGGLAQFADKNEISILRRGAGGQTAIAFKYGVVEYGRDLGQNVVLQPGDVVVVP